LKPPHIPVLYNEVVEVFSDLKSGYIIDCTLGYGGHSEALLKNLSNIKLIGIDQDSEALEFSKKRLKSFKKRVVFEKGRFSSVIKNHLHKDIKGILADIGVSSLQLDKKDRGFGFESDILDMRMDKDQMLSAKEVVNNYSKEQLEEIFRDYGEIREYKKVADIIVKSRQKKPIESARELASLIEKNFKRGRIHSATLVFQAIRIEVNDELGELANLLESIKNASLEHCKVAIITFHSLEDRIVKRTFKEWAKKCICPPDIYRCECGGNHNIGKIITKKPIIASKNEIKANPRSRSAKMRVFEIDKMEKI